jgi:hypothetical protein
MILTLSSTPAFFARSVAQSACSCANVMPVLLDP